MGTVRVVYERVEVCWRVCRMWCGVVARVVGLSRIDAVCAGRTGGEQTAADVRLGDAGRGCLRDVFDATRSAAWECECMK